MPTSNINQASFTGLRELTARQQQDASREDSQEFAAGESVKRNEEQIGLYNLKAGDLFLKDNPDQSIPENLKGHLGEHVFAVYEQSNKDIIEGKKLLMGTTEERRRGQSMISRANSSIKDLATEYTEFEVNLGAYVNDSEMLNSESGDTLKSMQEAQIDGKLDVVSALTAGGEEGDTKKYIQWTDEKGEVQHKSYDWVQNAIKGGVNRVDTSVWLEKFKTSTATSKHTASDGTFLTEEIAVSTYDTWIDDLVTGDDGKNMSALIQQFDLVGTEDAPTKVREKLGAMLKQTKSFDKSEKKTPIKQSGGKITTTDKKFNILTTAMAHRKYQVNRILETNSDGSPTDDATDYLTQVLQSHSYDGNDELLKGKSVTSLEYNPETKKVRIVYLGGDEINKSMDQGTIFNLISDHSETKIEGDMDMAYTMSKNITAQSAFEEQVKNTESSFEFVDKAFEISGIDKVGIKDVLTKLFEAENISMTVKGTSSFYGFKNEKIKLGKKEFALTEEGVKSLKETVKKIIATQRGINDGGKGGNSADNF